jgi:hypothetical protein
MRIAVSIVLLALTALSAQAAPFCAVFGYGRQCFYFDMNSCRQAAGSQGACVVNEEEVQAPSSSGAPFCVVQSFGTQCFYFDADSCRRAAANSGGACVVNSNH